MAGDSDIVSLRITLRYKDLDEFISKYAENVSSAGLFLRTKAPKPTGTKIRFELLLADGTRALRGEGVVVTVREDDKPGMALRFNVLDPESQVVVERVVAANGDGPLAPTPLSTRFGKQSAPPAAATDPRGRSSVSSWKSTKATWGEATRPGVAVPSSNTKNAALPRMPTRAFGGDPRAPSNPSNPALPPASTSSPSLPISSPAAPPLSGAEGPPPRRSESSPDQAGAASGDARGGTLPRKRSSVVRPWASGTGAETTDRIRVRDALARPGATGRVPEHVEDEVRTVRVDVAALQRAGGSGEPTTEEMPAIPETEFPQAAIPETAIPESLASPVGIPAGAAFGDGSERRTEVSVLEEIAREAEADALEAPRRAHSRADTVLDVPAPLPPLGREDSAVEATRLREQEILREDAKRLAEEARAALAEARLEEERQREAGEHARVEAEEDARFEAARVEAERREAERREEETRLEALRVAAAERFREQEAELERERARADRAEADARDAEAREAEQHERERARAERAEADARDAEAREAEQHERDRVEAEQRERDRLEAELRELERAEAERRERDRLEAEEQQRREAEQRERDRSEEEQTRREAEQRERDRLEEEQTRRGAEQRERDRLEEEQTRRGAEQRERDRLEEEQTRREAEQRERDRLSSELREQRERERERDEALREQLRREEDERRRLEELVEAEERARIEEQLREEAARIEIEPPHPDDTQKIEPRLDSTSDVQTYDIQTQAESTPLPTPPVTATPIDARDAVLEDTAPPTWDDAKNWAEEVPGSNLPRPARRDSSEENTTTRSAAEPLLPIDQTSVPTEIVRAMGAVDRGRSNSGLRAPADVSVTGVSGQALRPSESSSDLEARPSSRPPPRSAPYRQVIERDQAGTGLPDPAELARPIPQREPPSDFSEEVTQVPTERAAEPSTSSSTRLARDEQTPQKSAPPAVPTTTLDLAAAHVVGIDFGGRWVRISRLNQGELELIPTAGTTFIPAMVAVRSDGTLAVGAKARTIFLDDPTRAIAPRTVLHALKGGALDPQSGLKNVALENGKVFVDLGVRSVGLHEILVELFSAIRAAIVAHLNDENVRAVISIPSDLDPEARTLLKEACKEAKLANVKLYSEVEALIRAYRLDEQPIETMLMVDVGATHVGLAVARRGRDGFAVVGTKWIDELSGGELDARVVELTLNELNAQAKEDHRADLAARMRLLEAVERARVDIRRNAIVELKVSLPAPGGASNVGVERSIKLPRSRIYQVTEESVKSICQRVQELLREVGVHPRALGATVLAGSGGLYPPLVQAMSSMTTKDPLASVPPTHAFALGLARSAVTIEKNETGPIQPGALSQSVGIQLPGGRFLPLVKAGEPLPAKIRKKHATTRDNQTEIELEIYQGDAELVRTCSHLGSITLHGVPKGQRGAVAVELAIDIDLDEVVTVTLSETSSNNRAQVVLAGKKTSAQRRAAVASQTADLEKQQQPGKKGGLLSRLLGRS